LIQRNHAIPKLAIAAMLGGVQFAAHLGFSLERMQTLAKTRPLFQPNILRKPHFYFSIALLVAVGGFWPSFFSKLAITDKAHLIHGITATLWMTVPIIQSWLICRRKFSLHRKLGWATLLILAPLLVVSGLHMVQLMVLRYEQTHAIRLLKFTFLDLCAMTLFVTFLVLAVLSIRRNDSDAHARYMAGTVLFALEPALERVFVFYVPGVSGFATALYFALVTMELILLVLLFFEWRRRRVRLPFSLALGFFIAMHVSLTPVANSVAFATFAKWFARIG
jgi:hypothetical protein